MAKLVAYDAFDVLSIDLNWYSVFATGSQLLRNSNQNVLGTTYPDYYYVQANDGYNYLELDFFGSNITQDFYGNIISGTVNFIGEFDRTSSSLLWYASGFSLSAVSLYNAALSTSNQDEITLVQTALAGNDTIVLSAFDDRMSGYDGDDTITGGLGRDILSGGSGYDIFLDTAAGHNGDTITDFSSGDKIVFSDLTLASTFNLVGNTLFFNGGSLTLTSAPAVQRLTVSAAASGGVQITFLPDAPASQAGDFNGDGRDDLLLRSDGGDVSTWLSGLNGVLSAGWGTNVATTWKIVGTGDFNGDGKSDVLWRGSAGELANWQGASNGGFTPVWGTTLGSEWKVVGTGDFNGDGKDDILWRSTSGALADWLGSVTGGFSPGWGTSVDISWKVVGTGDFNGDGRSDVLWRSGTGALATWLGASNGGFTPTWGTTLTTDWSILGTGDFNGDGRSDVIWRSEGGAVAEWLGAANGGFTPSWGTTIASNLHAVSTGDFNGDGRDDILWQSESNQLSEWLGALGSGFTNNAAFSNSVTSGWHVQPESFL